MICVVVVSSAIAAVGFVSTMSLGVIQRTREIGLLRALGFTGGQVRTMITKESVALSATAVTFGMALGLVYGALGAQSLVGFETDGFVWGVPGPSWSRSRWPACCSSSPRRGCRRPARSPSRRSRRCGPPDNPVDRAGLPTYSRRTRERRWSEE